MGTANGELTSYRTARCSLLSDSGLAEERRQAPGGVEYSLTLAARFLRQPKLSTHASENLEAVSLTRLPNYQIASRLLPPWSEMSHR
jgi:hypothetical protein